MPKTEKINKEAKTKYGRNPEVAKADAALRPEPEPEANPEADPEENPE